MAKVYFENMTKAWGNVVGVNNLNLEIPDKEFLVLVGPSGCGKSTALRCLAGLEEITKGNIWIDERVVNDVPPKDRDIAMVFQSYALYPHMSVYDNMAFGLKLRKTPKDEIERRVQEAAKILGITQLLDRKPKQMSGGQRQRVALGRAIVREPAVFLMDEPLSNLDAELRLQIRQDIARLQRDTGITMLYVTHDQVEAMTLGQRIVVLKQGVLQQLGTAHELYARPANTFVAGFIGSPGMNIFTAAVQRNERGYELLIAGRSVSLRGGGYSGEHLAPFEGKMLNAGVRPEALRSIATGNEPGADFPVTLSGVERLGHEVIVHFPAINRADDSQVMHSARLAYQEGLQIGEEIRLGLAVKDLYLFDPDGRAIPRSE